MVVWGYIYPRDQALRPPTRRRQPPRKDPRYPSSTRTGYTVPPVWLASKQGPGHRSPRRRRRVTPDQLVNASAHIQGSPRQLAVVPRRHWPRSAPPFPSPISFVHPRARSRSPISPRQLAPLQPSHPLAGAPAGLPGAALPWGRGRLFAHPQGAPPSAHGHRAHAHAPRSTLRRRPPSQRTRPCGCSRRWPSSARPRRAPTRRPAQRLSHRLSDPC